MLIVGKAVFSCVIELCLFYPCCVQYCHYDVIAMLGGVTAVLSGVIAMLIVVKTCSARHCCFQRYHCYAHAVLSLCCYCCVK